MTKIVEDLINMEQNTVITIPIDMWNIEFNTSAHGMIHYWTKKSKSHPLTGRKYGVKQSGRYYEFTRYRDGSK